MSIREMLIREILVTTIKEMLEKQADLTAFNFVKQSYPLVSDLNWHRNLLNLTYAEYIGLVREKLYNSWDHAFSVGAMDLMPHLKKLYLIHSLKNV